MAFWNTSEILDINEGVQPNDGTGDSIRDAFLKVDNNFGNISDFLSQERVDFLNANIQQNLSVGTATFSNVYVANAVGATANFTSNIRGNSIIANLGLYSSGTTNLTGNTNLGNLNIQGRTDFYNTITAHAPIIPAANVTYDIGSPTMFFRNIYAQGVIQVNTVTASSDAGLLQLHANLSPGDNKDVGIFGKFYKNSSNHFAFFGYQDVTSNFVYKITDIDATLGNSVVYNGVYGNVQFGSQLLSNTTASTSKTTGALIVAGGVGVDGSVYATAFNGNITSTVANVARMNVTGTVSGNFTVDGNIYSSGAQVLTTSAIGYGTPYVGGIIGGNTVFVSGTQSVSSVTGAIVVPNGGVGVTGNIYSGANVVANTGLVGPVYGTIQTAAQPNITSVGTLSSLNVGSVSATSIGATDIIVSNSISMSGGTINNLLSLAVTGNITAGNVGATKGTFTNVQGTLLTAAQPNITSVGTLTSLAVTGNVSSANVVTGGVRASNIITTGNIQGNYILGDGSQLTGLPALYGNTQVAAYLPTYTGNVGASNLNATSIYGTVRTAAQTSITSVGTLTALTISGTTNASGGLVASTISAGTIGNTGATLTGTLNTPVQTNITAVGTLSGLTVNSSGLRVNGNIIASLLNAATIGNTGAAIIGASVTSGSGTYSGTIIASTVNAGTIGNTGATIVGTLTTPVQTNITSVGTLTGLTVAGNVVPSANVTYNLGSTTAWWSTVYGRAVQAQYADLAEHYTADAVYEPGTVVVFGGDEEITTTTSFADARVAGAISTDPAYLMNAAQPGLPVALRGRIPLKVMGPVKKGDGLVTSSVEGYAVSIGHNTTYGQAVFAKSIETNEDLGAKVITAVIL